MVVAVIDIIGVTINKFKEYTPIPGYFHCMKVLFVAAQLVEEGTRIIHISYLTRGIKPIKDSFKSIGMFRLNSALTSSIKKVFQAFMFKGFYHSLRNVTQKVTFVNIKFKANVRQISCVPHTFHTSTVFTGNRLASHVSFICIASQEYIFYPFV